jgi:hypothetical protein
MQRDKLSERDEAALSKALKQWQVTEPLAPGFNERVWQAIAREEALSSVTVWSLISAWLTRAFARPSLAVSYITLLLAAGLLAGYWQSQLRSNHEDEAMSSRYVQMVDPYQGAHH